MDENDLMHDGLTVEPEERTGRPEAKASFGKRLGHAFSDPGKRRIIFLGGLIVIVFGVVVSSQMGKGSKLPSQIPQPPAMNTTPGGTHSSASPDYQASVVNADAQRAFVAEQNGKSALATINPNVVQPPQVAPPVRPTKTDAPPAINTQVGTSANAGVDEHRRKMQDAMRHQLQEMVGSWKNSPGQQVVFTRQESTSQTTAISPLGQGSQQQAQTQPARQKAQSSQQTDALKDELVHAGDIFFGTTVTGAISTDPTGPIVADVLSGPLQGARILGTVQQGNEAYVLVFNQMSFEGKKVQINAVAVDVESARVGVRSDIDRRYPERALAIAADFLTTAGQYFLRSNSTTTTTATGTVTTTGTATNKAAIEAGMAGAGQGLTTELNRQFNNLNPIYEVKANFPIGVLFMSPIYKQTPAGTGNAG
ncbi:DotG/IcmE/VirB10 family protein [Telmatospirillum siberiense]|uniref:Type IV secretion protein DotG n=1 Tax=Telmatospirillum siberiense TaxID=382514 RepID=A0A2N3PNG8_9PROT|nr:DotG/IcmE/VirB10 family protein [Telmatospirillum siberiense]PKU21951.1 hypothetical protein CWS72_23905 [Telmatospirillum siberiense]